MRILAATDGSEPAAIGCELARDLATVGSGEIRIVAVVPPPTEMLGGPWPAPAAIDPTFVDRAATDRLENRLEEELARTPPDLHPSADLLRGRPAVEIVAEAERWGADVIVVGARGHGVLSSILLGSVSEEVVDRSPIPVLVARHPRIRRCVVAVDGSATSLRAADLLGREPAFGGEETWVVDVAPSDYAWWTGMATTDAESEQQIFDANAAVRRMEQNAADDAAARLRDAGLAANSQHRIGDAADQLVRVAAEVQADTIVIGSRGQTGLRRLLLGSVARHVLRHAPSSVLVVHPAPATNESDETSAATTPVGASR
jgi:nucleotide-binding universal stress UspA family protein